MAVVDLGRMSLGPVMQAATQVAPLICAKQYWYLIGYNTQSLLTLDLQENRNSTVVSEKLLSYTEDSSEFEPKEVEFVVDVISSLTLEAATSTEVFCLFVCLLDTCSASG